LPQKGASALAKVIADRKDTKWKIPSPVRQLVRRSGLSESGIRNGKKTPSDGSAADVLCPLSSDLRLCRIHSGNLSTERSSQNILNAL